MTQTSPTLSYGQTSKSSSDGNAPSTHEPIAIVGMACRFPGAGDLEAFWDLLKEGRNAVTESDAGPGEGRMGQIFSDQQVPQDACRYGAFVDDIDLFDAGFFRISPVEADLLDPQQRMMLEMSWLALEDAGIDPETLKGSRTGVYSGISNDEYRMLVLDSTRPTEAAGSLYALSGTNLNGTAGRVSFVLGLNGPAKAVDAACASALVAVHDAVADLQQGKADLAIAGGVQAILNPRVYELRAESMMLSPEGQCKTFDASADGYVRGEGCGVVVLKRMNEALADGDPIWAVILGAAVNHGGASAGLTVPHAPAMEKLIQAAHADAGVPASEVDYLEAHGTGTAVGDPIEIDAVSNVYGPGRNTDAPLLIGSVKTNIGHLESAAGIAGLIKAALAVKRGVIPKHLNFHNPDPNIDWENLPIRVTTDMMEWPSCDGRPRLAGINSFGISGTNAHVVLQEHRDQGELVAYQNGTSGSIQSIGVSLPTHLTNLVLTEKPSSRRQKRFLPLSGKSEGAVRDLAKRYVSWLDEHSNELIHDRDTAHELLSDMAWTAGVGRSQFDRRSGIAFEDAESLREKLDALSQDETSIEPQLASKVAFLYTGQGSQWVGMGQSLYESEAVVKAVMDRCEMVFQRERGESLLDVMWGRNGAKEDLGDTAWEQPALYALQSALSALWASVGIRPSVVLGHSVGEIAAAQTAGVFSIEDGMRFAAVRGTLLSNTDPGTMAAIFATPQDVTSTIEELNAKTEGPGLSIAGYNGAHQVVSGTVADIEKIVDLYESKGTRARRLNTKRAFHSALVEPALGELESFLQSVKIGSPDLTVISNVTGRQVDSDMALDGTYWKRHAREAVAFASGVQAMADLGVDLIIEIGSHAVLGPMATLAWPGAEPPAEIASLRRPPRDRSTSEPETSFIDAVVEGYQSGLDIGFEGLFAGEKRRRISVPSYPFQRERHWVRQDKPRRQIVGHPLLGVRHESARGEITFETEVFPSDPVWMVDHRVFGRLVAPGALYGAMATSATLEEVGGSSITFVDDMQLHNPLVFSKTDSDSDADQQGATMQVALNASEQSGSHDVQIYSKGNESEWTLHVECKVSSGGTAPETRGGGRIDLEALAAQLTPADVQDYYRAKVDTGIDLGPFLRTLGMAWSGPGQALAEVILPETIGRNELDVHPLIMDGCFQVVGIARNMTGDPGEATYLPFGWERFWLNRRLPDRVFCHVIMNQSEQDADPDVQPEVLSGELRIYDPSGVQIGGFIGYTVKRATKAALLSAIEGTDDLLYEVVWRERELENATLPADFLPSPNEVAKGLSLFAGYLSDAGVDPESRNSLLADMERWSRAYALRTLEKLGWKRQTGEVVNPEDLRQRLGINEEHARLFRRLFEMLANSGVMEERGDDFVVAVEEDGALPVELRDDPEEFHVRMAEKYSHGLTEVGLFRRSGGALADVLRGEADPLTLLFSSGEPTAADLYLKAPVARAANRMLGDAVAKLVSELPDDRRLRVLEIGAGTGSATASVLPELPEGRFEYIYTDISAGFFAEAEARFGDANGSIQYRSLDIEEDPIAQGFASHGYDILIASNVLHATRYLEETLGHCLTLLAPDGHLIALENLRGLGWMDLTFGQLDGWWRFADEYRPHHALAGPDVWRQALSDTGFEAVEVLGVDDSFTHEMLDKGVIVAQGPAKVTEPAGAWILTADDGDMAQQLAEALAERNQTVMLACNDVTENGRAIASNSNVTTTVVDFASRESWRSLIEDLPQDVPINGVVHLLALDGHGPRASTDEIAQDLKNIGQTALALVQGIADSDVTPAKGVWFLTEGGQVLERENSGELSGSILWGLGKVMALEASHLQARMIDLDPNGSGTLTKLVDELMFPDQENHIAYRSGRRMGARLVRPDAAVERLTFPAHNNWVLAPDPDGVFDRPSIKQLPHPSLEPSEVLVAVEATGLNFWDVFRSLGFIEEGNLGRELCGHVLEIGSEVSKVAVGDRVVGLGFGAFGPQMITHQELVAPAPEGISASALATIPSAFVSAELSYRYSGLEPGDRVLIHAGAGGVGLAAIQLAQAAGAEVFATASAPKRQYLKSLGVKHLFDSRTTDFGQQILEATGGEGIDVVLNSLTSEGFIDASLSCLAHGGRFVELARRDILTEEEMADIRPDVSYDILELDVLKKTDPERVGEVLRDIMERIAKQELKPLIHSRWPMAEAGAALSFMRSARHVGKIVLTPQPLSTGRLRHDRTYLVTGGLGGIGIAVAEWLAEHGAGTIILNGRRDPDPEAEDAIAAMRRRGVKIEVEMADMTDTSAIDDMLERMDAKFPPLAGVIHSVGVLSDAALTNQTWESFERVLWPKIIGAWHLHRATLNQDLDMFVLFSSRVGVMGNPGQSNHAAANAFLDQLAAHRRSLGLPGQAIAWGAWSEIGEAAEQRERIENRRAALGGRWFTPEQGMKAFEQITSRDNTTSVVMSTDWSVFEAAVEDPPSLVEELLSSTRDEDAETAASSEDVLSKIRSASDSEREDLMVSFLQEELQAVMRLQTAPSPTTGFFDLGMDSLMAVEFRNRLNRAFAGQYVASNTIVFDYPSVADLAHHLSDEIGDVEEQKQVFAIPASAVAEQELPELAAPSDSATDIDGVAIVGMACRFPKAKDIGEFWHLLKSGSDAITDGRRDNGSWSGTIGDPYSEQEVLRKGAFVDEIDSFDSRFFRISPIEARTMDPQQRMMLETTWHALEDAGIDPDGLKGSRTGVYVGVGASEYRDVLAANGIQDNYLGTTSSMAVGRVAFALGLEGPAVPVDLVCAASHAAVHQAVRSLETEEVDMALAGGVNAVLSPPISEYMTDLGMLSSSGESRPFDAGADGFVRGEGCGMLVLKRLRDAQDDGDRIWGVILGSAVNQNGASAGFTVPNGSAQQNVMRDALNAAGVEPSDVDYYEAHGGASQLGDPIELHAAGAVYGEGRTQDHPLYVGSVKANVGHTEKAAGVASIIKVVLSMKNGVVPKQLNFSEPNSHVDWDRLAIEIPTKNTEWPNSNGREPLAAISGFGMSGANAHIVLSGYDVGADDRYASNGYIAPAGLKRSISGTSLDVEAGLTESENGYVPRQSRLLPLSGKSEPALRDLAKEYLGWLEALPSDGHVVTDELLSDMTWTASVGRSHFGHRRGVVFRDIDSLRDGLSVISHIDADPETPEPAAAGKVAFVYADEIGYKPKVVRELYESEPAFRSVIDRCDEILGTDQGVRILEVMLGRAGLDAIATDIELVRQATYAFQCALTALWTNVGVTPNVVLARGIGELAAAEAAGEVSLEDGLRIAERGGQSTQDGLVKIVESLSEESEYLLIGIGESSEYDLNPAVEGGVSFVDGLARAYEAGVPISFEGLFAGESRRRIAIPIYPFQRRRHWA